MPRQDYEVVPSDPDVKSILITWYDHDSVFIEQIDSGDKKQLLMFNQEELKQVMAVLAAFQNSPDPHRSDCALHNSPAYPLEQCTCR